MNYPKKIKQRKYIDPKLGIKSSLGDIRKGVAALYVFYIANGRKSECFYSSQNGNKISISPDIAKNIDGLIKGIDIKPLLEKSPLIESQFESIFVFISLIYSLGVIKFNDKISESSERTGNKRYAKHISFSSNMLILDAIITSYSKDVINDFICSWLNNEECQNKDFEKKITLVLQIFSEQTVYKLRVPEGDDLILQTEGIYDAIDRESDKVDVSSDEAVGPFRIVKSALVKGLHPYICCEKNVVNVKSGGIFDEFCNYRDMVSTMLDISRRNYYFDNENKKILNTIDSYQIDMNYRRFITAIKSKPFLLLAGISGTGKSSIVRKLAKACWEDKSDEHKSQKPSNFEMVQVKPNWHDSTELIGYVSRVSGKAIFVVGDFLRFIVRAWENPKIPYFLCLDEMNLAPVEQYFAEYLSVIESRKANSGIITTDPILKRPKEDEDSNESWYETLIKELTKDENLIEQFLGEGISIPQNLIVIGTVNMDETTFSFSRKVLDRAMTIEMNEVNLEGGLTDEEENIGKLDYDRLIGTAVEGKDVYMENEDVCKIALKYLSKVNEVIKETPFAIAYRTRNEFLLYVVNNLPYNKDEEDNDLPQGFVIARALDEITSMKILSRIEGDSTKVSNDLLTKLSTAIDDGLKAISGEEKKVQSISLAKIDEMKERLESGYTSFWR